MQNTLNLIGIYLIYYINTGIPTSPPAPKASFICFIYSPWNKLVQALHSANPGLGLILGARHGNYSHTSSVYKIVFQRYSSQGVTACELPLKRAITM